MKKNYNTPIARIVTLNFESAMLTTSIEKGEGSLGSEGDILSNERDRTPSSFIWGDED